MDAKKNYAGPLLPKVPVVHHSAAMHPEFVACGILMAPNVKRTRRIADVTCLDCIVLDEQARKAKPIDAVQALRDAAANCTGEMFGEQAAVKQKPEVQP